MSNCSENVSISTRCGGRTPVIGARQSLEDKDTASMGQTFRVLHLEVSSWTRVEQTGITFLMSYDRFRAYKFALNVCTFL